jgi:hypothetical protein
MAEVLELHRAIAADLRSLLETGVRAGAFDTPHAAMGARALPPLGNQITRCYRDDFPWSPPALADFYADLALRMVGAPSAPEPGAPEC